MNEIIPLVSFPKSGNTWMRFILSNIFKKDKSFEINFNTINDISPTSYFEDHLKMKNLLQDESPLFIKEHYSYDKMPYNNFEKAIYIYRNGFDTMVSYWHFRKAQSPGKYNDIKEFMKYYWHEFGHWGDHLDSWIDSNQSKKHKIFFIKYEELLERPEDIIYDCLKFLNYEASRELIAEAIDLSSKNRMKKMGSSDKFMKSKIKNFHFVRSAKQGEGEKYLPDSLKKIFLSYRPNYDEMIKRGYLDEHNIWSEIKKYNKENIQRKLFVRLIVLRHKLSHLKRY